MFQKRTVSKHSCVISLTELLVKGCVVYFLWQNIREYDATCSLVRTCVYTLALKILYYCVQIPACGNYTAKCVFRLNGNQIQWHNLILNNRGEHVLTGTQHLHSALSCMVPIRSAKHRNTERLYCFVLSVPTVLLCCVCMVTDGSFVSMCFFLCVTVRPCSEQRFTTSGNVLEWRKSRSGVNRPVSAQAR